MKRSKHIHPDLMQKRALGNLPPGTVKPLVIATALTTLAFTGCSQSQQVTVEPSDVQTYKTVDDCVASGEHSQSQCSKAYNDAMSESQRYGPRFQSLSDCEAQFGDDQCTRFNQTQNSSHGIFGPLFAGFVIARVLDGIGGPSYRNYPIYWHRSRYGDNDYVFGDGTILGSVNRSHYRIDTSTIEYGKPKSSFKTKPAVTKSVTKTVSKGGFGSSSSARSSWGSGYKSSGWGG